MSTIITQGYGLRREAIITKGYGRGIEEAVVEIVERLHQRRVGGSRKEHRVDEKKQEECITIYASLIEANDQDLSKPISNEIKQCFRNHEKINIDVKDVAVSYLSPKEIKVEVTIKSHTSREKESKVRVRIVKKKT
jgi:hypothetical protein